MKLTALLLLSFLFCAQVVAQVSQPHGDLLRGETYVIEVRSCDEPLRRTREGYETTKFMRVYSKRKDRCGSVLTIIEVQNCKCYQEIFERDSVSALADATRVKVIYRSINGRKKMIVSSYKADRHPETNELSALQKVEWYLQGNKCVYYISFSSCSMFLELLPQVKGIVASLKEI